jgi:hypothetical protein
MTLTKYLLLGAAALALGACGDDDDPTGTRGPTALVRFVHAVPDTMRVNAIFVDDPIENLPNLHGISFRSTSGMYAQVEAGERSIRVFPDTTDARYSTQRLIDTTLTLTAGQAYTLVYSGLARGNNDYLMVIEDERPVPGATAIAIRAMNFQSTAVDVHVAEEDDPDDPDDPTPIEDPLISFLGLGFRDASDWEEIPALAAGLYEFDVADAGAAAADFSIAPNVPGAAPTATVSAQAGVRRGGSVLSAIVVPGALADAMAATFDANDVCTNCTPSLILIRDNVPGT